MRISLLFTIMFFLLASCSQKKESTVSLEVTNNFIFGGTETSSVAGGGMMVWGMSSTGASFARTVENNDAITLDLRNDVWVFFAMAWDGLKDYSNAPTTGWSLGGKTRCAVSSKILLEGNTAAVDLVLSNSTCAHSAFAGPALSTYGGSGYAVPVTKFRFCDVVDGLQGMSDLCTDDLNHANRRARKAPVTSFRVRLNNHFSQDPKRHTVEKGGIAGACINFNGESSEGANYTGTSQIVMPNLPAGGPGHPFHVSVETFLQPNCVGTFNVAHLPDGAASANSTSSRFFPNSSSHVNLQAVSLLPSMICTGRRDLQPFAGGSGTPADPYIICSVPQFNVINSSTVYQSRSFKLQSDLDFNPYTKGISNSLPANFACLAPGSNFLPIGYTGFSCSGSNPVFGGVTNFNGNFFGAGHRLMNLRMPNFNSNQVGLFQKINGSNIRIQEFELLGVEMSAKCRIGALAGSIEGGTSPTSILVSDIRVTNARLDSFDSTPCTASDTGGVTGYSKWATFNRIFVRETNVNGNHWYIGGAIGAADTLKLSRISVEADVLGHGQSSKIGGVVGSSLSSDIDFVKHEGLVIGNGAYIGGIVGYLDSPERFTNFYSISAIYNYSAGASTFTSALIGNLTSYNTAKPFGPGYTLSRAMTACTAACNIGSLMGNSGVSSPTTINKVYVLATSEHVGAATAPDFTATPVQQVLTYSQFITSGQLTDISTVGTDDWVDTSGGYPRFKFEKHPCSLSGIAGGDGSSPERAKIVCNHNQYFALAGQASGSYHKLLSTIRLPANATAAFDISNFNVHLDGAMKAVIGADTVYAGTGSSSHIGNLNGSIRRARFLGFSRQRASAVSGPPYPYVSLLVDENNGLIEDVNIMGVLTATNYLGGMVGINNSTGTVRRVSSEIVINGGDMTAAFAYWNYGNISHIRHRGLFTCKDSSDGCSIVSSFVGRNDKNISSVETGFVVNDSAYATRTTYGFVAVNASPGVIEDVLITPEAGFILQDNDHNSVAGNNTGTIRRVLTHGQYLIFDNSQAFNAGTWLNGIILGTMTDIFRTSISGKQLFIDQAYTCTGDLASIDWSAEGTYSSGGWNTWLDANYDGLTPSSSKKLVLVLKPAGLTPTFNQVQGYATGGDFTLLSGQCVGSGIADLYWTDDLPVNPGTSDRAANFLRPGDLSGQANYGSTWASLMFVPGVEDNDINSWLYHVYGGGLEVPGPTWIMTKQGPILNPWRRTRVVGLGQ